MSVTVRVTAYYTGFYCLLLELLGHNKVYNLCTFLML